MNNSNSKLKLIIIAAVILTAAVVLLILENTAIEVTRTTITSKRLPGSFSGFRIAHVSDLHNSEFGRDNSVLLRKIREEKPDIIVITGDLVDSRRTNYEIALEFVKNAMEIAPVYYVTGNHEARLDDFEKLETGLMEAGVILLRDSVHAIEKDRERILLIGLDDPRFVLKNDWFGEKQAMISTKLKNLKAGAEGYTVLLLHRPELFGVYAENDIDLVLSGHTHGGQIRIPFIGAVVVPDQGFFPKYDAGLFQDGNTSMIISRGLGNSLLPIRINCRYELVIVTLERYDSD